MGIGRPFLYAFSSYGLEGVDKALQILHVRNTDGDPLRDSETFLSIG